MNSMVRHHFHLHHGDFVRVDVTATNKADSSTSVTSNGVKIDLTEPKMSQLVDGGDLNDDLQYTVIITISVLNIKILQSPYRMYSAARAELDIHYTTLNLSSSVNV